MTIKNNKMRKSSFLVSLVFFFSVTVSAQVSGESIALLNNKNLLSVNVSNSEETYLGKESLKVIDNAENTEMKFVKLNNLDFKDGIIEIEVAGKPMLNSLKQARGFVGIAFRINDDNSKFECIYLRPTNGRAQDQIRRNHSVQYISFPDYPWYKLRKGFPGKYESYVDLQPEKWIKVKIEIKGTVARLYINNCKQPSLIINDLKHGLDNSGKIGLWVGPGSEAHFANLLVLKD